MDGSSHKKEEGEAEEMRVNWFFELSLWQAGCQRVERGLHGVCMSVAGGCNEDTRKMPGGLPRHEQTLPGGS